LVAHLHLLGTKLLFSFSFTQDYTDASMMIAQADQDGFASPDRDYYLTHQFKDERAAYRAHLARMFGLLGDGAKKAEAEALSYAQGWCVNSTDEFAKEAAKTDPHSPGKYRVNGVLVNTPAFREAFACKLGAPMAPAAVYRVW
jgi:predicted metalloendopeptidase